MTRCLRKTALFGALIGYATSFASDLPRVEEASTEDLPKGAVLRLGSSRMIHPYSLSTMAFSPKGDVLASVGGGHLLLWDLQTSKLIDSRIFPICQSDRLVFSSDGTFLSATTEIGWNLFLCHLKDDSQSKKIRLDHLCVSNDGQRAAGVPPNGTDIQILSLPEGKVLQTIPVKDTVCSTGLSPDGSLLVTGTHGGKSLMGQTIATLTLWDARSGQLLECRRQDPLESPRIGCCSSSAPASVGGFHFSSDGNLLLSRGTSSNRDGGEVVWDVSKRSLRKMAEVRQCQPMGFCGDALLSWREKEFRQLRFTDPRSDRVLREETLDPCKIIASPKGDLLALADSTGAIRVVDAQTMKAKTVAPSLSGIFNDVAFSPDGKLLASVGGEPWIYLRAVPSP